MNQISTGLKEQESRGGTWIPPPPEVQLSSGVQGLVQSLSHGSHSCITFLQGPREQTGISDCLKLLCVQLPWTQFPWRPQVSLGVKI